MSIQRLFGGLTPGDGEDPRTFPVIFNEAADLVEANEAGLVSQGSRLSTAESDIDALEAKNPPAFSAVAPDDGQVPVFDAAEGVFVPGEGGGLPSNAFAFVGTLYFTSSGTFTKADFPFLRAVRVKCQGGGAGGAGSNVATSGSGGGGGGGGYAESFITNIAGLDASVTVTRGARGASGAPGESGSNGVDSSFGTVVIGNGGLAGQSSTTAPNGGDGGLGTGDLVVSGSGGDGGNATSTVGTGRGGDSHLGGGGSAPRPNQSGSTAQIFGGGGGSGHRINTTRNGGNGADGIVIIELFA